MRESVGMGIAISGMIGLLYMMTGDGALGLYLMGLWTGILVGFMR